MLNLKNNKQFYDADEICKKIYKNQKFFFGQHPLIEKSPPATDRYIYFLSIIRDRHFLNIFR